MLNAILAEKVSFVEWRILVKNINENDSIPRNLVVCIVLVTLILCQDRRSELVA